MMIKRLSISRGVFSPLEFLFERNTIITSDDNSKGKTTLLRFLLYALGYKIPSTKKVDMTIFETIIEITNSKGIITICRIAEKLSITYDDGVKRTFDLSDDSERLIVQSIIFETSNFEFLKNLLMIIYIDQDRGWTLLNRGKAIGSNRFDVSDFFASLSGIDVGTINRQLKKVEVEIKKFQAIKDIVSLKNDLTENNLFSVEINEEIDGKNRLLVKRADLQGKKNTIERRLKELEKTINDNKDIINYITSYNLLIKHKDNEQFILSENDIVDFEVTQSVLDYQSKQMLFSLYEINDELNKIDSELKVYNQLIDVNQYSSNIVNSIMLSGIDTLSIDRTLISLRKEKSALIKSKNETVSLRTELIEGAMLYAEKFSRKLGVYEELIGTEKNFLFTSNLKEYSGTIRHMIVFSFRLAFNIVASEVIGIKLPLILDSPGASELTRDNINEMISLAKESLPESQIIIATINKNILDLFQEDYKNIHLNGMLLDS